MEKIPTICPFCGCGCGINLLVEGGQVIGSEGRLDSPTKGYVCIKGRYCWEFVNSPDRLKKPLKKVDGKFVEISWEQALREIGEKLKKIKEEHGPDAIGFLASAKCTNEENYVFQKFARVGLGTYNVDSCARLCHLSSKIGLIKSLGYSGMTNSISDISDAELIILWGCNPFEDHPFVFMNVLKAKNVGKKVVVIDPRKTKSAGMFEHMQIKPATDMYLIAEIISHMIEGGLWNKGFVEERTIGFNLLKESVKEVVGRKEHGIEKRRVDELAKEIASKKTLIFYGMGITQHTHGLLNVLALCDLALITGNVGAKGRGICPLRGQNNVQGAGDMGGITETLPGYCRLSDPECRKKFDEAWHTDLPQKEGLSSVKMLEMAGTGEVKALYIVGENPAVTHPSMNETRKELRSAQLLIVQDIFMTETAELAHYVLPAACFAEKEGTFTNTERRVQKIKKAAEPPGEAREDWQIICELAKKMGIGGFGFSSPEQIFRQIRETIPIYSGIDYAKLGTHGVQWPCNAKHPQGLDVLYKDSFATSDRRGHLFPLEECGPEELPSDEYPLVLTTGRMLPFYHSDSMTGKSISLKKFRVDPHVFVNQEDAKKLGIVGEQEVVVKSRRGSIRTKAKVSDEVQPGLVFISLHHSVNILTGRALDPVAKTPEAKYCAVRIEHAEGSKGKEA